jgi:hypothetical protein
MLQNLSPAGVVDLLRTNPLHPRLKQEMLKPAKPEGKNLEDFQITQSTTPAANRIFFSNLAL